MNLRRVVVVAATTFALAVPVLTASAAPSDGAIPKYSRAAFGDGWAQAGHGCDTRDTILRRDITAVTNANRCGPIAGTLRDPYSGIVVVGPTRQLDIDHRVPLELAWSEGAWRWTQAQRERFANDPAELVTTTAKANRSKGSRGLDHWLPAAGRCDYARRFDAVADRYGLVDPRRDGEVATACR